MTGGIHARRLAVHLADALITVRVQRLPWLKGSPRSTEFGVIGQQERAIPALVPHAVAESLGAAAAYPATLRLPKCRQAGGHPSGSTFGLVLRGGCLWVMQVPDRVNRRDYASFCCEPESRCRGDRPVIRISFRTS